jgi:hypothetical protein
VDLPAEVVRDVDRAAGDQFALVVYLEAGDPAHRIDGTALVVAEQQGKRATALPEPLDDALESLLRELLAVVVRKGVRDLGLELSS